MLGDRVAKVGQGIRFAVVVSGEGGTGGGKQIGEIPPGAAEKSGEAVDLGKQDRDVGDGGPRRCRRGSLLGGMQVGENGLRVEGRARCARFVGRE